MAQSDREKAKNARSARQAAALRANLQRRKTQARARVATDAVKDEGAANEDEQDQTTELPIRPPS